MAPQRPMSTPIFDELLREFASRMEDQPEPAAQAGPPSAAAPTGPATPAAPVSHRHRAE